MIPYGRQEVNQDDVDAVVEVLQSEFLTQGPNVPRFEQRVADYCGARHAVSVNSATSALHVGCLALGLGPGDLLWTTTNTFVASANCALYCGAQVGFVDIDPRTYNLCPRDLERRLVAARREGRLPKVVVAVHLCGQSCDMQAIHGLAGEYGFRVIEDASHAIGGRYQGAPIGDCRFSDIVVFSFHPVKIVTTAEGGMALTNDPKLLERMHLFRSHGITRDPALMTRVPDGPWYYQQVELGYNYRMTELQAALGLSQMKRIDEFVARRHQIARRYDALLAQFPVTVPWQSPDCYSGLHLYPILLDLERIQSSHRQVFESMRSQGVGVNLHYIPVHTQPYFQAMGFREGTYPVAEDYYSRAISLPIYPGMDDRQQDSVVAALANAVSG